MHWGLILLSPVLLAQARTILDDQRQEVILNDASSPLVCGKCEHNVRAIRTIVRKDIVTYNTTETKCSELVEYSIDENGCEKATVACKGFSFLDIFGYGTGREGKMSTFLDQDVGTENSPISGWKSFSCLQYGWEYNSIECLVGGDVHNPDSCSSSNEEATTTPNTDATTTSISPTTTTTEEDCTTTTASEEQTTSTPINTTEPLTVCGKCDPLMFHRAYDSRPGQVSTCNIGVDYTTDEQGCQQANVTCTGYGLVNLTGEGHGYVTFTHTDNGIKQSTLTLQTKCQISGGWSPAKFYCYVTREVENAPPCIDEQTTATASSDTTTTSIPPATRTEENGTTATAPIATTTEEDCETTMSIGEQTSESMSSTPGTTTNEPSIIPVISTSNTPPDAATTEEDCDTTTTDSTTKEDSDETTVGLSTSPITSTVVSEDDCSATEETSSLCSVCEQLPIPWRKNVNVIDKGKLTCNVQVDYSKDTNGCQQATLTCTGHQFVIVQKNNDPFIAGSLNTTTSLSSASISVSCTPEGWLLRDYYCIVGKEVENPTPCPEQEASAN